MAETQEKITPALSAEEWAKARAADVEAEYAALGAVLKSFWHASDAETANYYRTRTERRHALAALLLHGQPFGFTHEMLSALSGAVANWRAFQVDIAQGMGSSPGFIPEVAQQWELMGTALECI